jgi:GTP cyclohydrolase II
MTKPIVSQKHIVLTSHPSRPGQQPFPIRWGQSDARQRGPVIATLTDPKHRNAIGSHAGAYAIYRALAVANGALDPAYRPDLTDTSPAEEIGPFPAWSEPHRIVSLDPFGAVVCQVFHELCRQGYDIRPTIAVTKAHINIPELYDAVARGRVQVDGAILRTRQELAVTKVAIDPVWYLPGMAHRFGIAEGTLRRMLFEHTGGMFPELVTRPDLSVFLPPIGGVTVYIVGPVAALADTTKPLAVRVHDECNGSDVFGSDICTCRPYLVQCPQASAWRRPGRDVLYAHRVCGGGPGRALSGAHARRAALVGYHQDRYPRLHERYEVRCYHAVRYYCRSASGAP